jgi:hypothetical protein
MRVDGVPLTLIVYAWVVVFCLRRKPNSPIVTVMGERLVAEGCGEYEEGPRPQWTEADRASYRNWQQKLGYTGPDADGWPGPTSWEELKVPKTS